MYFYVIGVHDEIETMPDKLAQIVEKMRGEGHIVVTAWIQDERDPTPPGEAQYQRRTYW